MTDAREHALTIKGYLMASNAPAPMMAGIEIIIGELASTQATISARIPINNISDIASRFLSRRASGPANYTHVTHKTKSSSAMPAPPAQPITQESSPVAESDHIVDADKMAEEPKPRKPRKPMSEERKAQLCEQLIHARAARKKVEAPKFSLEDEPPAPVAAPRKDSDPDKLIHDHAGYIGERTDKTLTSEDWSDIQKMRYNGLPDARVAKHYGVELDYLQRFIKQQEAREEREAKNG